MVELSIHLDASSYTACIRTQYSQLQRVFYCDILGIFAVETVCSWTRDVSARPDTGTRGVIIMSQKPIALVRIHVSWRPGRERHPQAA